MATGLYDPSIKEVLPHGRIYTLQIGNESFQVSGASLSSDSPSYFTNYFLEEKNKDKTLIIDRSNEVFKLILQHLQGYHLEIPNADIFTRLFNDALYYNLPQLLKNLTISNDYYYTIVESEYMKIPKKIMSNPASGNFPNFFSVSNDALYKDINLLMASKSWIRPPPQAAPSVARSVSLLKDLILMLENIELKIQSKEHRRSLIKEAKYYRFNGLVQKLIDHRIVFNPVKDRTEIVVMMPYIDHKFITLTGLPNSAGLELCYQRPFNVDSIKRPLIFQVESNNGAVLDAKRKTLTFKDEVLKSFIKIFKPLLSKSHVHSSILSSNRKIEIELMADDENSIKFYNEKINLNDIFNSRNQNKKRKLGEEEPDVIKDEWVLKTGLFRFFYTEESDGLEAKILKAEVFPNTAASFYNDLEFL